MDGNRRWARKHGLRILAGHEKVAFEIIEPLIKRCLELGIPYLTLWAFSTENWQRNQKEVTGIMRIFKKGLKENVDRFQKMGVRLKILGDLSKFDKEIKEGATKWVEASKNNKTITLSIAINYGGREEILRAIKKWGAKTQAKRQKTKLTEDEFGQYLDTAGLPDPDLIIRTGGARRLSGFLPWQAIYAELYFTKTLMPDFNQRELDKAILEYSRRERRFGR
jgi:undecaprenyl diphosphate synthase